MNNNLPIRWLELDRTILVSGKNFVRTFLKPWASLCYCFSPDVDGVINLLQASTFGEKACCPVPNHSSFLVRVVLPIYSCPTIFPKICGQVSSIVLHPFSSRVEGEIPNDERRDVYELNSSSH